MPAAEALQLGLELRPCRGAEGLGAAAGAWHLQPGANACWPMQVIDEVVEERERIFDRILAEVGAWCRKLPEAASLSMPVCVQQCSWARASGRLMPGQLRPGRLRLLGPVDGILSADARSSKAPLTHASAPCSFLLPGALPAAHPLGRQLCPVQGGAHSASPPRTRAHAHPAQWGPRGRWAGRGTEGAAAERDQRKQPLHRCARAMAATALSQHHRKRLCACDHDPCTQVLPSCPVSAVELRDLLASKGGVLLRHYPQVRMHARAACALRPSRAHVRCR